MARAAAGLITHRWLKYLIVIMWLVLVAVSSPLAGKLTSVEKNEAKSWLPGSAESTQVLDVQSRFASPDTIPAVVVYERASGLTEADRDKVAADAGKFGELPVLDGRVVGPLLSEDGKAAQVVVPLNLGADGWSKAADTVDDLRKTAESGSQGLKAYVTGPAGMAADSAEAFEGIDSTLLLGTIAVVVIILLVVYRSPVLWLLPVISAGVALVAAQAVVYLLAKNADLTVNAQSAGILTVLVFGAGTDYALLLVARYREELRRHADRHEAMAVALHRAGPAIIASGATVIAGMLCLSFAEINSTKGLGPVAAIGIVVGLGVMMTLLPALLVTVGRWIFWPVRPKYGTAEPTINGFWAKIGGRIAVRPRITWVFTSAALAVAALGVVQLDADGLTNAESFRNRPDSVTGETVLARHFPAGSGNPVVVISKAGQAEQVRAVFAGTEGIDRNSVAAPVVKGDYAYLEGTLNDPPDGQRAFDTIDRVRDNVHRVDGADAKVGGNTAVNLDMQRAAQHDNRLIIPIVLVVVFIILVLLLRALLAPLLLIGTVVLSFAAALGVSALVFRHVFGFAGADSSLPLFVFVFLVALGIDYNIFLMTRVREESINHGTRHGALIGLAATGGVITAAGIVLAGTFTVLGTMPLTGFVEIGFAVAFGVLLDTIVVRAVLVTALNLDIGRAIWWPSRLAKPSGPAPAPAVREADRVSV